MTQANDQPPRAPHQSQPIAVIAGTGHGCRVHVPALRAAGFAVAALVGTDAERTRRRAESNNFS